MKKALVRVVSHPRAPIGIALLALLLASPALWAGLVADDHYHALILQGGHDLPGIPSDPWALFRWADGTEAMARAFMEVGMTGWWTDPHLLMSFMRPVSVLTHRLDYALFPDRPFLMHVHTFVWFGLALFGLLHVYRRIAAAATTRSVVPAPAWVASLCLLLYAVDDAHGLTLSWVCNRNALVALALALPVLTLHDRGRRGSARWPALAAPLLLLVSLLAGESALAVCAYLFCYALFLDPAGVRRGLMAITPFAVVALGWSISYRALGFGARGSGLVVDPGSDPGHFLVVLAARLPALLSAQLAVPPSDLWEFYDTVAPWLPPLMLVIFYLVVVLILVGTWGTLRKDAAARFWPLGGLLSAVPVCAQFPSDRLLTFIGVGGMGFVGHVLARVLHGDRVRGFARVTATGLAVLHLGLAPLWLPLRARQAADIAKMIAVADRSIDSAPGVQQRTVVLINPPVDAYAGYIPPLRAHEGRPRPDHLHWLATAASAVEVERLDDHTLRVRPSAGFLARASERMQRSPDNPMPVGYQVVLSEMTITVTEALPDGRAAEIHARFRKPLDHPDLHFQHWAQGGFTDFPLPPPGKVVTLDAVDFASLLP